MKKLRKNISKALKLLQGSSDKFVANSWRGLIEIIEQELPSFKVDSAYRQRYSQWIELIDESTGDIYEAEVTKYSDGEYELMPYNINKTGENINDY